MFSETARVNTRVVGEDNTFQVQTVINGREMDLPVNVASIKDGDIVALQLKVLIEQTYRRAYRDGYAMCQATIRDALGIK